MLRYSLRSSKLESLTTVLQTIGALVARMNRHLGVEVSAARCRRRTTPMPHNACTPSHHLFILRQAANAVVQPLLQIWDGAGDKNVLRKYVLSILTSVSGVVRPADAKLLYPVVQPMLDVATSGGSENVYLTDDALRLWLALMRVATEYDEGFHLLFPRVINIGEMGLGMGKIRPVLSTPSLTLSSNALCSG